MIGSFVREVISPDLEKRKALMYKLASIRGFQNIKGLRNKIRKEIDKTLGKTYYYMLHKGVKILIGDETVKKKYLLLAKEINFLKLPVSQYRNQQKSIEKTVRRKFFSDIGLDITYSRCGGVLAEEPGFFLKQSRVIRRKKVFLKKIPKTPDDYIGIELEFASRLSFDTLAHKISEVGLHEKVRVMRDGSITITPECPYPVELCILSKYSELSEILNKLKSLMISDDFIVNNSCGCHVHIDARREKNVKKIFENLTSMQSLLFSLVDESRKENSYCTPVLTTSFDEADGDNHYAAISKSSWYKHRTIEVRIANSTLDLTHVEKWVKLLKTIADYRGEEPLQLLSYDESLTQLKTKINPTEDIIKYIEETVLL